uniref:Cholecystokinin/sulfakinin 2 n=1 Tax=Ambigolimax valentianus TaxID=1338344 RepID=A0A2Z6C4W6_9EUPU|nr:cholecystokinin/sulfakinin 2 [Ambigolimax valentianus]
MESTRIYGLVIVLASALAVSAASLGNRRVEISHLVSLLGKIQEIARSQNIVPGSAISNKVNSAKHSPNFSTFLNPDTSESFPYNESPSGESLRRASGSVMKREGGWSYDYGLGGGRFGKRNYGDYGIGGGRFGRDVDHVDLPDGNDADLAL